MEGDDALEDALVLESTKSRGHPVRWFAAGASSVAVVVAVVLYASGYFAADIAANADEPNIIESQQ